jgi:excisionase family DNA binding protein
MTAPTPQARFLRVREAAQLLGLSWRTLDTWRHKGVGPAWVKLGRAVRYDRDVLLAWAAGQTCDAETTTNRLLRIGAVARLLNVSVETMRRWTREGKITAIRTPGGEHRYHLSDVQAILESGTGS